MTFGADAVASWSQHESFVITVIEVAGGALPHLKGEVNAAVSSGNVVEVVAFHAGFFGTGRHGRAQRDRAERNESCCKD